MSYTITAESPDSLVSSWPDWQHLRWSHVFILPQWLSAWWREFGTGADARVYVVRRGLEVIGIAPLIFKQGTASFMGSDDVCDYLDFVVAPGGGEQFFEVLLDRLPQEGIHHLELAGLRPESTAVTDLVPMARSRGLEARCEPEDVSVELALPATWEEYLDMLTPKQRREVTRKLRRLREFGDIDYSVVADSQGVPQTLDIFLKLLRASRKDKAAYMNATRASFFERVARDMSEAGLLRFGIVRLNDMPIAALMYFDYQNKVYLYNSGYDPRYSYLSVGLLSKVLCIRDSIRQGRHTFDFMKGGEVYKYRLGGRETPLYRCHITLR